MSPTPRFDPRTALVAALVLVVVASTALGATAAAADPTVRVADADLTPGGTTTVDVVLSTAPDGLAGFAVAVSLDGAAARIDNASYPETFGLTSEPVVADDGARVTLQAADLGENVQPGATDVTLATLELRGTATGQTQVAVEPLQFDTDGGDQLNPPSEGGTVTVSAESDATSVESTPTDEAADPAAEGATASSDGAETTSTAFAFPAGGILLTALALALSAAFVGRRRH